MANRQLTDWELIYPGWDPQQQALREALCALGNGYFLTRGAFEAVHAGGPHSPGTYLAGGDNRLRYYLQRTSHGATLSRIVHSWVVARGDRERAWKRFEEALHSDIEDVQGGTTPEGIHLGAIAVFTLIKHRCWVPGIGFKVQGVLEQIAWRYMAGTVDLIQRMLTGLEMRDEVLWLNPALPAELRQVQVRLRYRGHWLSLNLTPTQLAVSFDRGGALPACIGFGEQVIEMGQGESQMFSLT